MIRPPLPSEILRRHGYHGDLSAFDAVLRGWWPDAVLVVHGDPTPFRELLPYSEVVAYPTPDRLGADFFCRCYPDHFDLVVALHPLDIRLVPSFRLDCRLLATAR